MTMSAVGKLAAAWAQAWLQRFRARHDLLAQAAAPLDASRWLRDGQRLLLHVGCGQATLTHIASPGLQQPGWREIRLDADAEVFPDIVGTMTDMCRVPDAAVDAVFSSHGIEHLYWHDVPRALREFQRVLADDGFLLVTCPDLQAAARMIAEDRMFDTAYVSAAGPITPFDIVYSYRPFVEANPEWMAHHCGFTLSTLTAALNAAGFAAVLGRQRDAAFDLWVLASKSPRSTAQMQALTADYFPAGD